MLECVFCEMAPNNQQVQTLLSQSIDQGDRESKVCFIKVMRPVLGIKYWEVFLIGGSWNFLDLFQLALRYVYGFIC